MPNEPPAAERSQPTERVVYVPRRSWFGRLLRFFLFTVIATSLVLNLYFFASLVGDATSGIQEKYVSHNRHGSAKVAIIPVEGVILNEETGTTKRAIDRVMKDPDVKAIVLRVDSPGGTISGSDYLLHHLNKLTKERQIPLVVSMGGICASGGYYVSMAAGPEPDRIFAEPTTWTGSIGVVIPHYNFSGLCKEWGIQEDAVASHRLKTMGSLTRDMTDEERAIFQALVDEDFAKFKDIIKSARPKFQKNPGALDELATGQVYSAPQALKLGLVDKIGFVEDAVDRAIALAQLDPEEVRVVEYQREPTLSDMFLSGRAESQGPSLAQLLDAATPRAYYLWSRVPLLMESGSRRKP